MDIKEFHALPIIEDMTELKNPKVGMCFLTGSKVSYQKESKNLGDSVTWYEIISVKENGNYSYVPRYSTLIKSTEER